MVDIAQHADGTGPVKTLYYAEGRMRSLPGFTALRAGYFVENWASVLGPAKSDGVSKYCTRKVRWRVTIRRSQCAPAGGRVSISTLIDSFSAGCPGRRGKRAGKSCRRRA